MKKLLFIFAFIAVQSVFAQDKYRVIYDYATEEVSYYHLNKNNMIDDTLSRPKFKKNSLIEVKLKNVNPFAVDVKTDIKEEAIHETSGGFNFGSLLGGINSFGDLQTNINTPTLNDNLFTRGVSSRGDSIVKSRGQEISSKISELNALKSDINVMKTTLMSGLLNPNMNKDSIIQNLKKSANKIRDIRLEDPNDSFYSFIASVDKVVKEDTEQIDAEISTIKNEIEMSFNNDETLSRGSLNAQSNNYSNLQKLLSTLDDTSVKTSETLTKIQELYASLEASSFEQTYDYLIEADKVNIALQFVQSPFAMDNDLDNTQATLKERNLNLFSTGGVKINTSVALTLNNFGDKAQDYFIDENNTINAEVTSNFIPNLATMINFYPVISENFNIGGSFGLSIPITNDIKGVNFLLGPSIFMGSKNRVSLSAGAAYGPVNTLTNGLEVGDETTILDIDNYTKTVYDFGYYFGVSFSLFDIN